MQLVSLPLFVLHKYSRRSSSLERFSEYTFSFAKLILPALLVHATLVERQRRDASNPPSSMDLDISNVGDQFDNDDARVMGNDDWDDMVRLSTPMHTVESVPNRSQAPSLLQFYDDPARSSSTMSTVQQYPPPPSRSTTMLSPYAQQNTNTMHGSLQPSYAAVVRRGIQESIPVPLTASPPTSTLSNIQQQRHSQTASNPDYALRQLNCHQYMSRTRPRTYAQALRSSPTAQLISSDNQNPAACVGVQGGYFSEQNVTSADQWRPNTTWHDLSSQESAQTVAAEQSSIPGTHPQFTGNEMPNNFNWQPGIAEPFTSVHDWAGQSRATGDRTRPRLNTRLSIQRPEPTSQSPLSTSSPSSSRISSRRNKEQLVFGKHRCGSCVAAFDTIADLNHHLRSHTPYEQRPYRCDTCANRFMYGKDLRRHRLVHNPNALRYLCHFTNCKHATIGFKRDDHLERHLRTQHAVDSVQQSSHPSSQHGS